MVKTISRILMGIGVLVLVIIGFRLVRQWTTSATPTFSLPEITLPQPTPTIYPSPSVVIEQVQALSRLETASYHVEKVITAESGQGPMGFLFGDRLLLIAYGEVIAGVDLAYFGPDDVAIDAVEGTIFVRLPAAEIFVATLDNNRTYVYDRRTGVVGMNPQLETAARQEAERFILQAALEDGVLDAADDNARVFMRSLLLGLGFEHVIFVERLPVQTPTPFPTLTATPVLTPTLMLTP